MKINIKAKSRVFENANKNLLNQTLDAVRKYI